MLNNYLGNIKLKTEILNKSNELFAARLKDHLNHEDLLKNGNIIYKYNNVTLNFTHIVKDFKMDNMVTKGL